MIKRIFVEKKSGNDIESKGLLQDLRTNLAIGKLESVRILVRYDCENLTDGEFEYAKNVIFSEPPIDILYEEEFPEVPNSRHFSVEYLSGQYDQRADFAQQALRLINHESKARVATGKVLIFTGDISDAELEKIKNYYINPVESRETDDKTPSTLTQAFPEPEDVPVIEGFGPENIAELGLAMDKNDAQIIADYFKSEGRAPTLTEIRVLDTYWSDHCRHTTFLTTLENVDIEPEYMADVYSDYLANRPVDKSVCLMDIATAAAKRLSAEGKLAELDASEEINACSIEADVDVRGSTEKWLIMFKNETHNHPTEIEPFGGAATCLGGAIRDPLSGRAYVYQAMRITGSGDPRTEISKTLPGKLPQRKITTTAANGYSSYGNQIGLATGQVAEIYDEGYVAKRMELGAVIAAAPKRNIIRQKPRAGDVVILLGGRTGRDGCGGATGSSKAHDGKSLTTCGAEVQKGNAPQERAISRLFRNPEATALIKRCNDFGAGGVCVAVGELADGLVINLDRIPKKYEGLNGTELAISESQERMAVVTNAKDAEKFILLADSENLEATIIAEVVAEPRLMRY
ncbi:MAG: phosphoribosylformylglycinamidine synthase, partial [Clostridiales bacterium]|nr:phosphoribosylformylglycinamidine synthase [Clostridiales bacterium]